MTQRMQVALALLLAAAGCDVGPTEEKFDFAEPDDGELVTGIVPVAIEASPPGRVAEVLLRVAGVEVARLEQEPFAAEIDTTVFPDGPLLLSAEAVLTGGGSEAPATTSIRVDNHAPDVRFLPTLAAYREDGDQFAVRLVASDANEVTKLGIRVISGQGEVAQTLYDPGPLPVFSFAWADVRPGPIGDWQDVGIVVQAVDAFGRVTEIEDQYALGTRLRWRHNLAGLVARPPLVADDGTLFVGATKVSPDEGRVVRLDPATGDELCQNVLGIETLYSGAQAGALIVFGTSRAVRAFRRDDCTLAWTYGDPVNSPRSYWGTPAHDPVAGLVYLASADGNLVAINATSGAGSVLVGTGDEILSSPVVGAGGDVFVGSVAGRMFGYTAAGAPLSWSPYATAGSLFGDPLVARGLLYFGSMDSFLYALDPATGQMRPGFGVSPDGFAIRSTPALAPDGTALIATVGGTLHAIAADGSPRWQFPTGPISRGGALVAAGDGLEWTAYIGSTDGNVYAVDQDGALLWSASTGADIQTRGALAGGAFYTPSDDFHLYAYAIGPAGSP